MIIVIYGYYDKYNRNKYISIYNTATIRVLVT